MDNERFEPKVQQEPEPYARPAIETRRSLQALLGKPISPLPPMC
jgi:hypothetical protein